MNEEVISFKSQYILEMLSSTDKGFTYNITYDSNNDVTSIIWITLFVRDNFERLGIYLSIDIMRSSVCNTKKICYIASVV